VSHGGGRWWRVRGDLVVVSERERKRDFGVFMAACYRKS
jgi:hypothetical protein